MLVANTLTWMLAVMMTVFYQRSTSTMAYYSDNYQSLTAMTDSSIKTPREKPHLIIMPNEYTIAMKIVRNSSGHMVGIDGIAPEILYWLARRYDFDYTIIDSNLTTLNEVLPALTNYRKKGDCDMILGAISQSIGIGRLGNLEIPHSWLHARIAFLIPMPEVLQNNVDAVIKPFQGWVWIGLALAFVLVVITLLCFKEYILRTKQPSSCSSNTKTNHSDQYSYFKYMTNSNIFLYVIGTLLNQGGHIPCKITYFRLAMGAWCLLIFVLLNVYNGVLISFVMAIHSGEPIIKSMEDVAINSDIKLVVDRNQGPDIIFSTAKKGLYKSLGDKLRSYPNSRCNSTQDCIEMVKALPHRHVYFNTVIALKEAMKEDYSLTHQCNLIMAAEDKSIRPGSFLLRKHSPYLEEFNRGILTVCDTGLILRWVNQFEADTKPCTNEGYQQRKGKNKDKTTLRRLSLGNLAGAFAVLVIGYFLAILNFLYEIFVYRWRINRKSQK